MRLGQSYPLCLSALIVVQSELCRVFAYLTKQIWDGKLAALAILKKMLNGDSFCYALLVTTSVSWQSRLKLV